MAGVMFSASAAERISKAVRRVEKSPRDMAGQQADPREQDTQLWGYITSCDATGLRHSFVRVFPDASADTADLIFGRDLAFKLAKDDPVIVHEEAARELNGGKGITNTIVRLTFIGYDGNGEPAYVFDRPQENPWVDMPPHDHRDNYNGGFAFAVFHPGTGLPQKPWAIY